ncbi:MAG: ClpXP protease specificity-enhancing factor, partial [Burkholderia sp.]|nr:ClpXP protease specificity-enhancing factor [Burkholderia sp.]
VAGEGADSGAFDEEAPAEDVQRDEPASPLTPVADSGANEEPSEGADEPPKTDGDGSKGGSRPRLKIVK